MNGNVNGLLSTSWEKYACQRMEDRESAWDYFAISASGAERAQLTFEMNTRFFICLFREN